MYYEEFDNSDDAFIRERRLKKWKRAWKLKLIERDNPSWDDLAADWY
jgi:putative endonuclease